MENATLDLQTAILMWGGAAFVGTGIICGVWALADAVFGREAQRTRQLKRRERGLQKRRRIRAKAERDRIKSSQWLRRQYAKSRRQAGRQPRVSRRYA